MTLKGYIKFFQSKYLASKESVAFDFLSADFEISQNSPRRIKISGKHDYSLINPLSVLVELQSADKSWFVLPHCLLQFKTQYRIITKMSS